MSKQIKRSISLFLVIIMMLQISGIMEYKAFATDSDEVTVPVQENIISSSNEIIGEEVSAREEYVKHFLMEDGTWIAAVYPEAVHYEKDGEWIEIDNTLKSIDETYQIPTGPIKITGQYTAEGLTTIEIDDVEDDLDLEQDSEELEIVTTPNVTEKPVVSPNVSVEPTAEPSVEPTVLPTEEPKIEPSVEPMETPTPTITINPEQEEINNEENVEESGESSDNENIENGVSNQTEVTQENLSVEETVSEICVVNEDDSGVMVTSDSELALTDLSEPTPVVTPEPTPVVTPEPTPVVTPEPTPVVTPEPTPVVTPESTPVVTPESTPEVTPELDISGDEEINDTTDIENISDINQGIGLEPITPIVPGIKDVTIPMWQNTSNNFGIRLPATLSNDSRIHLSNKGYDLYFGMVLNNDRSDENVSMFAMDANTAVTASIDELEYVVSDERLRDVDIKAHTGLTYTDVMPGVDVQYILRSKSLKETIVIDSFDNMPETIGYTISAEGLIPAVNEDSSIDFLVDDEVIFHLPAPYMFDAGDNISYDIEVKLMALDNGEYLLVYTPNSEWISDEEREWPVSIDPIVSATASGSTVFDTYVGEGSPTSVFNEYYTLYVGDLSGYSLRSFIKFGVLPTFSIEDVILEANLYLHGKGMSSGQSATVGAHRITSDWTASSTTWNNQPTFDPDVTDYQIINSSNWNQRFRWDITAAAKQWYTTETNYGIALVSDVEGGSSSIQVQLGSIDGASNLAPSLVFSYSSANGLEDYWDYTSQDVGRAGTVYVNNFTGNLVLRRTDMSYSGNRMPAAITLNYNFNDRDTNIGYGKGWSMDYAQLITVESSSTGTFYRLTDGDGTAKDFYMISGNVWQDEAGQGYTLSINSSSATQRFTVTDKENNKLYFDNYGRLLKMVDGKNSNNAISIAYTVANSENLRVSTVTDGAGRTYYFTYTDAASGNLSKVVYKGTGSNALETVSYAYNSNGCLTTVTYADGNVATYAWSGTKLTQANDIGQDSVSFDYFTSPINSSLPIKVKSVTLKSGSTLITSATFDYGQNYTKVTDNLGRWCTYQFNDYGNTISVYNDQGQALYGRYAKDENSSNRANQLLMSSRLQDTVINLLPNPSFESTSGWTTSGSLSTAAISSGQKSMALTAVDHSVSTSVSVTPGETYTLSGAFKASSGGTAQLYITAGSTTVYSEAVKPSNWTRAEVSMEIPSGVTSVTVGAKQTVAGTVYLDDFQFEKADASSRYNLVTDSNITHNSSLWQYNYGGGGDGQRTIVGDRGGLDTYALQLDASYFVEKYAYQEIYIPNGSSGDTFTFGTWVKTGCVPMTNGRYPNDDLVRKAGITLEVYNGSTLVKEETVLVNDACREWQFISGTISPGASYTRIVIKLLHEYNHNESWYDGVQVFRERFGYSYEYDDNGNVTKITDLSGKVTKYNYISGTSDVSSINLPSGATYSYSYDTNRKLIGTVSATGVTTSHSYDSYGNCTTTKISYGGNSGAVIQSNTSYTNDGNMTASVTTDTRQTVTYSNNTEKSLVNSVTDAENNTTNYTYDVMRRLLTTRVGDACVSYTYGNDKLLNVSHTGQTPTSYVFSYGVAGLTDSVSIGTGENAYTLVQNAYNSGTWTLASQTYGNGDSWHYFYSVYDDLVSRFCETIPYINKGVEYKYCYNNVGQLARIEVYEVMIADNAITSRTFMSAEKYYYDTSNRLICMLKVLNGGSVSHKLSWNYDANDNVTSMTEDLGMRTFTYTYAYNDDQQPVSVSYDQTTKTIGYDNYGRQNSTTVVDGGTTQLATTYTYNTVSGYETNQISKVTNTYGGVAHNLSYTYDDNGNILTVSDGTYTTTYAYDELNQLILEKNQAAGKSWAYTYDDGGNILSKTEYANANATGTGTTIYYSYGNSQWGDLLTAYNGKTITYDDSGNMLNDGTLGYTWSAGRQLASMYEDMYDWTYSYNEAGLRTNKNGMKTYSYTYKGDLLIEDACSSSMDWLYFHYDQNGDIIGFSYNSFMNSALAGDYYYIKNLQGDVIGVVNESGELVASYTYDAWGKILSVGGSNSTIANRNPIRYRGYYYDAETGFYYLQSRYYDPDIGRFINGDTYASTGQGILGYNMYAYCQNNPIIYSDYTGDVLETAFDIATLGVSIAAVAAEPTSFWTWAGLLGDVIDLLPGVTCVGEAVKTLGVVAKTADASGDIRTAKRASDAAISMVQGVANNLPKGDYSVYVSYGKQGVVNYVGITNNFKRRQAEWARVGRKINEIIPNVDKTSARWCEQVVIDLFGSSSKGGMLDNIINSISHRNAKYSLIDRFFNS